MKKLFMILTLGILCCGCENDPAEPQTAPVSEISVSGEVSPGVAFSGGTVEVTVTSNDIWRLSGRKIWCHPSVSQGKNGDKVIFTIDPNPTDEIREETYKFFTGNKTVTYSVMQLPNEVFSFASEDHFELNNNGGNIYVRVLTNLDYTVQIDESDKEWIFPANETRGAEVDYLCFRIAGNSDYSGRSGRILFIAEGVEYPVTVVQKQLDALIVEGETALEFDNTAREIAIRIQTNVELKIAPDANWITLKEQPQTRALDIRTLTFSLTETNKTRTGSIRISNAANEAQYVIVTIKQTNPDALVITIPDINFRKALVNSMKVAVQLDGDQVELLPAAQNLTQMSLGYRNIESMEGVQHFPALETLDLSNNRLTALDISELKNIKSLKLNGNGIERIILGDNPVTELNDLIKLVHTNASWRPIPSINLVISGTQLKCIMIAPSNPYDQDELQTLDVSGCPALETLRCDRAKKQLVTLYLGTGQEIANLTKNDNTQIEYK